MKYFLPVIGTETYLHKEFISICMPYKRLNWRFFFVLADVKQIYRVICKAMFTYISLIEIIIVFENIKYCIIFEIPLQLA